jgi:solute:Na+ symporter, SSS family
MWLAVSSPMSMPAWLMFFALGTSLWAFFKTHPGELNPLGRTDEILPWFIIRELPPGLAGIVIAALFAAAMSSLDSGMNSMATAITTDFYQRFWPKSSQRASLWVARLATAAVDVAGTGFAIYMAYLQSPSVWNQFLKIMGLFGGGLGGLFLAGIFTRRTSRPSCCERYSCPARNNE